MSSEIVPRIQSAIMDMMEKVRRVDNGKNHGYERTLDGSKLAGVTEISSYAGFKEAKGWMPAWGAKEAVSSLGYFDRFEGEDHLADLQAASEKLEIVKGLDVAGWLDLLTSAKGGYARKSDRAKDTGTEGHEYLERWTKAMIRKTDEPAVPEFSEEMASGIRAFAAWAKENVSEFVLSEARVAMPDEPYEYAGTLDALALMKDGNPAVIDFKFADNVSISWPLQLVGYAETFRPYGIPVERRIALRFPKSSWLKKWDAKNRLYKKIPNTFEAIEYPSSRQQFDFETFVHFRKTAKWVNAMVQ